MKKMDEIRKLLTKGGLEEQDYQRIRAELWESNRKSLCAFSAAGLILLLLMSVVRGTVTPLHHISLLYLLMAAACALIFGLSQGPARKYPRLTGILMYCFLSLLLIFSILLGTVYSPGELAVTYIALLLAVPQVFTDRPGRMCIAVAGSFVLFAALCLLVKERATWGTDLVNAVVFSLLSVFCCAFLMKLKLERYLFEDDTRILAETDQLTGTLNRNSYELRLRKEPDPEMRTLSAVYVDVNRLHEINNEQGHAAGDAMLCAVAQVMKDIFGGDNTFRIGGDEFVALAADLTELAVQCRVEQLQAEVAAAGYHVAVGVGFRQRDALDVTALIREAEQEMYRSKEVYYRKAGIEHQRKT